MADGTCGASLRVGLTGGIGSGKSTVARAFAQRGVAVLDADEIARNLVQPGTEPAAALYEAFGAGVFRAGQLDRAAVRELVFRDDVKRKQLEAILHPRVYALLHARASQLADPYCILCIPLLIETAPPHFVDRVLVVDCRVETQIDRVIRRDATSEAAVRRIIARQASREERLIAADDVIDNDGGPELVEAQVETLHHHYLRLAAVRRRDPPASGAGPGTID